MVTHFNTFNVTTGTFSENTYRLNLVDRVGTTINGNQGASAALSDEVTRTVGFSVRKDQGSTITQDTTVKWRFSSPGYYGLYKGTRRVSGTFSQAVCRLGWGYPKYERWGGGTYTTFGPVEEGTVLCSDVLPPRTVRRAAQAMLGCSAPTAGRPAPKAASR
ncbi:hypothetical protein [Actinoplanes sichuanensis]|uniref:Uncharacterized protein n=1 Tax=Actinoplanes sichuanensis TaxID=512349 RepID=A0ABW4ADU9_9ACTN